MDLRDYLRVLRKRWMLIALCALVCLGGATAYTLVQTPTYQADAQLFVSVQQSGDQSQLYQQGLAAAQRVKSYADIIASPRVTQAVKQQLHLPETTQQLSDKITADNPLDTVLLNVHVTDPDPARAQAIANAVADQFGQLVGQLEKPQGSGVSPVKVSTTHAADLPTAPVSPKKKVNLGLGLLVGLALGVGGAVLFDVLDTTVKGTEDLHTTSGSAVLGVIGFDPDARKSPLIVQTDPHSPRAEAFRQLRTNLQFVDIDHPVRSIVVTSSIPEEGKTTTTANLAITLAQAGLNVVLVEGDLRRPKLMEYLGLEGAVGLTSVLIGQAELDDVLQPWGDGLLQVLPSGPTPPNPSELLGSQGMADLVAKLEDRADIVLIDAPPLLPVTDSSVLAKICDGALLVVRQGATKRDQVARAVEHLSVVDAHLIGTVLNMAPAKGPDAYAYGYAYRYTATPARATGATTRQQPSHAGTSVGSSPTIVPERPAGRRRRTSDRGVHAPFSEPYNGPDRRTGDSAAPATPSTTAETGTSGAPLSEEERLSAARLEEFFAGRDEHQP